MSFEVFTKRIYLLLLTLDTNSRVGTAGSLGTLTTDLELKESTDTTVSTDLTETFEIFTLEDNDFLRDDVLVFVGSPVTLTVKHPRGDTVLLGVFNDLGDLFPLFFSEATSTHVEVNTSLLADDVSKTTTDTGDSGKSEGNTLSTIDRGVHNTVDVLEVVGDDKRHITHVNSLRCRMTLMVKKIEMKKIVKNREQKKI